jgi:uncharacterized membrane protein
MKFQLERIALFSDAVFAIAITLMIIEIKPPHLDRGVSFETAMAELVHLFPTIVGTILSFYLIGMFWRKHHEMMRFLSGYDNKLVVMNIWMLLSIAFLPFSTAFVFENLASHSPLPFLIYNINYIVATLLNYRISAYILHPANNLRNESAPSDLRLLKREALFQISVYCLVIILAFINADYAGLGFALFALENRFFKEQKETLSPPMAAPAPAVSPADKSITEENGVQ